MKSINKNVSYRILLRKEPEGGYTVIVPSLPGCISYGESVDDAIEHAKEAIEIYIETLKEMGEEIPTERDTLEYTIMVSIDALTSDVNY